MLEVPVKINALPDRNYSCLSTSIRIPSCFTLTEVVFNEENITGDTSYSFANHQLQLKLSCDDVNVRSEGSKCFGRGVRCSPHRSLGEVFTKFMLDNREQAFWGKH